MVFNVFSNKTNAPRKKHEVSPVALTTCTRTHRALTPRGEKHTPACGFRPALEEAAKGTNFGIIIEHIFYIKT